MEIFPPDVVPETVWRSLERWRGSVPLPAPGHGWASPEAAWGRLVGQICAIGSSRSWDALSAPDIRERLAVQRIRGAGADAGVYVHQILAEIQVRYCSPRRATSQKANAIAANARSDFVADASGRVHLLDQLRQTVGEPDARGVWSHTQACDARRVLTDNLQFFGPKSASDFLLGLGLADSLLALDVRLLNLLVDFLGWDVRCRRLVQRLADYERLEQQVVATFCKPLDMRPVHLDRLLFYQYRVLRGEWANLAGV